MPRFSLIVPVYNIQNFVKECIVSITQQSFLDYELLLINDGSTDNSGLICDEFTAFDERIKVIHKENGGLSDARNTGIAESKGEYIIFIDGDDYIEPLSLEKIDNKINSSNSPDVLITRVKELYQTHIQYKDPTVNLTLNYNSKQSVIEWVFGKADNTWTVPRYIINRCFMEKHNLKFLKGFLFEGIDWTSKLFLYAETFSFLDYYWYNYRRNRDGSIMNTKSSKGLKDVIDLTYLNINRKEYNETDIYLKTLIFQRMVKSVFPRFSDYKYFSKKEKRKIIILLRNKQSIFKYSSKLHHKLFIFFCRIFGFRVGLCMLNFRLIDLLPQKE